MDQAQGHQESKPVHIIRSATLAVKLKGILKERGYEISSMKSKYVYDFNHDGWAAEYDGNVQNEDNPIRAGYAALLGYIATIVNKVNAADILDVGAGTGNLSEQINACHRLVCLDISTEMLKRARPKLSHLDDVSFVNADFLEFFENNSNRFDFIISSYALHHLTEPEKEHFISMVPSALKPKGKVIIGDLMFKNASEKMIITEKFLAAGKKELVGEIDEEFFWNLESAILYFNLAGFETTLKRFSELSFVIEAQLT